MEYSVRMGVSKVRFILAEEDSVRREGGVDLLYLLHEDILI